MILAVILVSIFVVRGIANRNKRIRRSVVSYMERIDAETEMIRISDFTDFEWNKMLVSNNPIQSNTISEALGIEYDRNMDLISVMLFMYEDKIVYEEIFDDVSDPPEGLYSYLDRQKANYKGYEIFTPKTAVFLCKRFEGK